MRLLAAFQQAGLFAAPGARSSVADVLALHPQHVPGRARAPAAGAGVGSGSKVAAAASGSPAHGAGPGEGHARMVAALLQTLQAAGFLEDADAGTGLPSARGAGPAEGRGVEFVVAASAWEASVVAELAGLDEAAARVCTGGGAALASNVKLVGACLGALPGILTGAQCQRETPPDSSTKMPLPLRHFV